MREKKGEWIRGEQKVRVRKDREGGEGHKDEEIRGRHEIEDQVQIMFSP